MQGALFLALLTVFSAPQDSAKQPEKAQGCTVEGLVLKAGTEEPLKKAWLTLRLEGTQSQSFSATTDATGRFTLKDIEPGRYRLSVERNGYVRQEYGQRGSSPMVPAAVIAGRISDEEGEAAAGAVVQVMRFTYMRGKRELLPAGFDRADDLGEYRIYGLAPGKYYVSATLVPGMFSFGGMLPGRLTGSRPEESYPPTFYPGTNDAGRATQGNTITTTFPTA